MLDLDADDSRPLYTQIMDEIRRGIVLGTWSAGEALPSVRQLSSDLRVNPNTVQQAYRELEREGVVYVMRGQGTFVAESAAQRERGPLLDEFARNVIREAYRSGFSADEVIGALQSHSRNGTAEGTNR
jgi:GntR family transcriptional regulator